MTGQDSKHDQYYEIAHSPVQKVIPKLALPSVISMLVTSIYNMADTFFVSQIGTSASGAVGIIFSAMSMIQAISFMIGIGSGGFLSRSIGGGNRRLAERLASIGFFTGFGAGIIIAIIGNLNLDFLVHFLGATETIAPYAKAYAAYIFFAAPFMVCSLIMNNLLRFQGKAFLGMIGVTAGGILNILLDPIFIFALGFGTAGAAIATGLSQFISFCILLIMCNTHRDCIPIRFKNFTPTRNLYREILCGGIPSLGRQGIASIGTIILNITAGPYGDAAIAAMSIISRFMMFINSAIIGFGQGFQPVCSYCYGAHYYKKVQQASLFCIKWMTVILLVFCAVCLLLSGNIIAVFRRDDPEVIEIGTFALRLQLMTLPLSGVFTMANMMPQSMGYGARATLVSTSRQGWILIPVLLMLESQLGLRGIQCAQPVTDLFTFVLAVAVLVSIFRQLSAYQRRDGMEAPEN